MTVKIRRGSPRYPDLTPGQHYVVIGVEADDLRLLNDEGKPYLYPRRLFQVLDEEEPDDWVSTTGADGERYAYPPPLNGAGFFEDFFDQEPAAVKTFWRVLNQQLAAVAH